MTDFRQKALERLAHPGALRNFLIVLMGTGIGQVVGFLATLVLLRTLGPEQFGLYASLGALMVIISQLGDLGLNTAFVRYATAEELGSPSRAALTGATLLMKVAIGCGALIVGMACAPWLVKAIFKGALPPSLLVFSLLGSLGLILWGFNQAVLQSHGRFKAYAILNATNQIFRFLPCIALLALGRLDLTAAVAVTVIAPFLSFGFDRLFLREPLLERSVTVSEYRLAGRKLWQMGRWVTISMLATMLMMRVDVLLLQTMAGAKATGVYASANQLAMLFPMISAALTTVLLPKISSVQGGAELARYVGKSVRVIPAILVVVLPLILVSDALIPMFFGPAYVAAVPLFKVLLVGYALSIAINPLSLVLYSLDRADLLALMNVAQFVIFAGISFCMIPVLGPMGSALASLGVRGFGAGFIGLAVWKGMRKVKREDMGIAQ